MSAKSKTFVEDHSDLLAGGHKFDFQSPGDDGSKLIFKQIKIREDTHRNPYPSPGYGFQQVWVRVSQNPGVYQHTYSLVYDSCTKDLVFINSVIVVFIILLHKK